MPYDAFDLTGKVALITGGNGGIGLGMAGAIARAGGAVCIWGTNEDKNAAAAAQLEAHGGAVAALVCDVSDEDAVEQCFAQTLERFGHVDGCFANAGVAGRARSFLEMTAEEWRRVMAVNLDGAFFTLRAAARHMVEHGAGGSLVVTASLAAIMGQPTGEQYAATKGGVIAMMRALAVEFGRNGLRANAILPGWIDTDMTSEWLAREPVRKRVLPRVPLRRWGTGDDFAGIAVYLASDASAYHSGDTFVIDGAYALF